MADEQHGNPRVTFIMLSHSISSSEAINSDISLWLNDLVTKLGHSDTKTSVSLLGEYVCLPAVFQRCSFNGSTRDDRCQ